MVDVAEVRLWGEFVGAVRWNETQQLGFFEYAPSFIQKGWDIAPIKMPVSNGSRIYSFPELRKSRTSTENTFKGLPGLLSDALPDRFGNQLINVWLALQGRQENTMNPVEKLCFIGTRGMGALEFEPAFGKNSRSSVIEVDSLVNIAQQMLHERERFSANLNKEQEQAMKDILKIGTSAGGARPKALITYNEQTGEVRSGQGTADTDFNHWLLKLDGVSGVQFGESSGWGRVEYAYYLMAKDAGIEMSESRLLEENGRAHFMTKRFDRTGNDKHHVQTLCGLQHYDYNDMFSFSYEQVFSTMRILKLSYPEAEQQFRRMVFNVLAVNYDDHTKNFSFILKKNDRWRLAPAYDMCFSYDSSSFWVNQQTLSINGKRKDIQREDLLKIAKENSIKKGAAIIEEIQSVIENWSFYAAKAGVRADLTERIQEKLNTWN